MCLRNLRDVRNVLETLQWSGSLLVSCRTSPNNGRRCERLLQYLVVRALYSNNSTCRINVAMGQNPVPPVNIPIPTKHELNWVVHLSQNGTVGFDPQPCAKQWTPASGSSLLALSFNKQTGSPILARRPQLCLGVVVTPLAGESGTVRPFLPAWQECDSQLQACHSGFTLTTSCEPHIPKSVESSDELDSSLVSL